MPLTSSAAHVVLGEAGRTARQVAHAHHLVIGAVGHPVVVVLDEVDDGQPEGPIAGQVVGPLRLGRPVERLEHDAVGVRPVAREAAHHPLRAAIAQRHGRARGDRDRATHDRVGPQVPGGEVADVHAAAAAVAVPLVLAEELGDRAVDVLLERRREPLVAGPGGRVRQAGAQRLVRHPPERGKALGDRVAVPAVGARDVVIRPQRGAGAHRRGLLADRDVRRAAVVVAGERAVAARAEPDDHLLELADGQHVVEEVECGGCGQSSRGQLRGEVAGVGEATVGAERRLEGHEVRSSVAVVCGLRGHARHLWLCCRPLCARRATLGAGDRASTTAWLTDWSSGRTVAL